MGIRTANGLQLRTWQRLRRISACNLGLLGWFLFLANFPVAARVQIKPGFNMFSPEQDVQLGQEAAQDVEKQMPVIGDRQLNDYLNRLGQKLARLAPGQQFPYQFHLIYNKDINAFALPGGPIYIHTGVLSAASNEAQLAGVLAHEISHIALRHSTNQASKAMLAQAPLAILGGVLSGGGLAGQLAQLGISFGINSTFLKFSRDAERQADELGAQILYDAGYDPKAMAQFFEVLERQSGGRSAEFFSNHPNPGNRQKDISALIPSLGPAKSFYSDSAEFQQMKQQASQLKEPRQVGRETGALQTSRPSEPSRRSRTFAADWFRLNYPDNWEVYGQGSSTITFVPPSGIIQAGRESLPAIAYGALVSLYEPQPVRGRQPTLEAATDQLVRELQKSNPNLRVTGQSRRRGALGGQATVFLTAVGQSPLAGETEVNWIVSTLRPEGLFYIVFIAPQRDWNSYEPFFRQMIDSVRFPQ